MTPFYTRTGDEGDTGLLGEGRVPKDHDRIEALGALDEATAAIGVARAASRSDHTRPILIAVQRDLYGLMAEVGATKENAAKFRMINDQRVQWLEDQIDIVSALVEVPKEFILPGDTEQGAALDLARTIVRRAERRVVALYLDDELENIFLIRYLNRLSSLCFMLELLENKTAGTTTRLAKETK
jgi:cob(I)alamin adenosyltransferase